MKRRKRGGSGRKTREEGTPQRRSRLRPEKTRILIVCEGRETEPNYFRGLRDEETVRQNFHIEVKKGKGGSCLVVVQQAIAERTKAARQDFDEVWCVFDVELAGQREQLMKARTLAEQHGMQLAISNPSFECWLLAHFVRTKRSFTDCDEVIEELNKHWRLKFGQEYEKNDEQLYARLAGLTQTAIRNARKVRTQDWASSPDIVACNSATDVYLLIERLFGPSE